MLIDRDELELQAKEYCPATLWYELLDVINETSDADLIKLINKYK
jgi:hypothetical protein